MRLGGPLFREFIDPDSWISALKDKGYRAGSCPVVMDAEDSTIKDYREAARECSLTMHSALRPSAVRLVLHC
jgi:hypothetical protein